MAARGAILHQTTDKKLQQKFLGEDLLYTDTVKYGLAVEQGRKKVNEINTRVARLEEQLRRLQTNRRSTSGSCQTCTRPAKAEGDCPGEKVECFMCGLVGHFKGSAPCKGQKPAGGRKKKYEKDNPVEELSKADDEESDTDSIGRVAEIVRAAGSNKIEEYNS
jgi:hypothetical protein